MSLIGQPNASEVSQAWLAAMHDVLAVKEQKEIPELNEYQCGTYIMHSLEEAQAIAKNIISQGISINLNETLTLSEETLNALNH